MSCPRCGNPNNKVFLAGSTHDTAEERCDKCVKVREPKDLEKLRRKFGHYSYMTAEPIEPEEKE